MGIAEQAYDCGAAREDGRVERRQRRRHGAPYEIDEVALGQRRRRGLLRFAVARRSGRRVIGEWRHCTRSSRPTGYSFRDARATAANSRNNAKYTRGRRRTTAMTGTGKNVRGWATRCAELAHRCAFAL